MKRGPDVQMETHHAEQRQARTHWLDIILYLFIYPLFFGNTGSYIKYVIYNLFK